MIDTDLTFCEADLTETVAMFGCKEQLKIKHRFTEKEDRVVNTVTVNGQVFAYGNLIRGNLGEVERKRIIKRFAKLSLYKAISKTLNIELPWGSLTGVRPTKLAYQKIDEGEDFAEFFTDTMRVSEKKTALTKSVIWSQKGIYEKNADNTDFFVFIPFCPSRCEYCSFITEDLKSAQKKVAEYVSALISEIKESTKLIRKLKSIYIGGGTPVALPREQLIRILDAIDEINTGVEYTVEAGRPDAITKDNLSLLKQYRVTRICVNPQTFSDKTLKIIGRNHTSEDTVNKYNLAKDDFSVNMDLIAGLPEESFEDFKNSIDRAVSLSPDGITVHTLSVKHGSTLSKNGKNLEVLDIEKMIDYAHETLSKNGYVPYYMYRQKYMAGNLENTGYSKPDKFCEYNVRVMEEISQNIACGAGAVSKAVNFNQEKITRYGNPKDVTTYIQKINEINREKNKLFSRKK